MSAHHRQPGRPFARGAHAINRQEDPDGQGGWHHDVRGQEAQGECRIECPMRMRHTRYFFFLLEYMQFKLEGSCGLFSVMFHEELLLRLIWPKVRVYIRSFPTNTKYGHVMSKAF